MMEAPSDTAAFGEELTFEVDFAQRRRIEVGGLCPDTGAEKGFMLPVYVTKTTFGPEPSTSEKQQAQLWRQRGLKRQRGSLEESPVECEI
ncbi:hypothetical protein CMUS01_10891 [Colletotrichum musicola]|uniref:Uncharacterized protein n=1 Tax=Colletotrichum musicola TaxID=2175873 RepID=A0A8H6N7C4_9PEZI|nr:hypothetical protein CMUS01_10891 [Colletotrichum musicola]